MSALTDHPAVAAAIAERDRVRALAETAAERWRAVEHLLCRAQTFGVAEGRTAREIEPDERAARDAMDRAWSSVVPANEAVRVAQLRVIAAEYAAEQDRATAVRRAGAR